MCQTLILIVLLQFGNIISQLVPYSQINAYPCQDVSGGAHVINVTAGPCYNTLGCQMPDCCGVIAGAPFNATFTYNATETVQGGTIEFIYTDVTVAVPTLNPLSVLLPTPVDIPPLVLQALFQVNTDMCYNSTANVCPQTAGNVYSYTLFAKTSPILTSTEILGIQTEVKASSNGKTIFCSKHKVNFFSYSLLNLLSLIGLGSLA